MLDLIGGLFELLFEVFFSGKVGCFTLLLIVGTGAVLYFSGASNLGLALLAAWLVLFPVFWHFVVGWRSK